MIRPTTALAILAIVSIFAGRAPTEAADLTPVQLKCEYAANPLGVDVARPRFSWVLKSPRRGQVQTAYQILVASSQQKLQADAGDKWDSGQENSDRSVKIAYQGKVLASGERCWWKIRAWDKSGSPSEYSAPATFEMSLLHRGDWKGKWIAMGDIDGDVGDAPEGQTEIAIRANTSPAPMFRKEFEIDGRIGQARVYVSGLGYCELYVNGQRLGDRVLDPATSNYHNDQPYEMSSRVLYVTYDVTQYLKPGRNALGIQLGKGWFSGVTTPEGILNDNRQPYGDRPMLLLQLNIALADGQQISVVTDSTWKTSGGPLLDNDIWRGESYDARLEMPGWASPGFNDSAWQAVVLPEPSSGVRAAAVEAAVVETGAGGAATAPNGVLVSQFIPPARVVKTFRPVKILNPAKGVYVFDFGQNMTGWTRLRVRGPRSTKVAIRHSPTIYDDGHLDMRPVERTTDCRQIPDAKVCWAAQTETYILKGDGLEQWEPRFTVQGFRYAEVTGFPGEPTEENLVACFVHTDVDLAGDFACSNQLINQIHHNARMTFLGSLQGIPQDAADRGERVAYLGDTGCVWEDYIYNIDMSAFTAKWLWDIRDTQRPTGELSATAPRRARMGREGPSYSPWPAFISTYTLLTWYAYQYYEDTRVIEHHYDALQKMLQYKSRHAPDHILTHGLGDHMEAGGNLGGSSWAPRRTSPLITSTAYYYYDSWLLARMAEVLGRDDDARRYDRLADEIKQTFNQRFFDESAGYYGTGSQTANALALHMGMVSDSRSPSVVKHLAHDITVNHNGHLSTGMMGTNALEQALADHGLAELMYGIATQTTPPSWGYQVQQGATTIFETWDGAPDHCMSMKMLASTEKFFYKDLGGIAPAAPGFRRIQIKPRVVGDLTWVKASYHSVRGPIAVHWRKGDHSLVMEVTIPTNTTAVVSIPTLGLENVAVTEGTLPVWQNGSFVNRVAGITGGSRNSDYLFFDVGSGDYNFRLIGEQ